MFTVIGIIFGLICVFTGYLLHGGSMGVFVNAWTEFIVILGGGLGIYVASNGIDCLKKTIAELLHMLKPSPYSKAEFTKLLTTMYQLCTLARREGLLAIEGHLENPAKSSILGQNHTFLHAQHAKEFFCDTMKLVVSGGVDPHELSEMMELDLEVVHQESGLIPDAIQNMGDAMPAVGIVACVLGVVITMGRIGGDPAAIGEAVGVALVGTFLGILSAYVVFFPVVRAILAAHRPHHQYLNCIRHVIFCCARGESPQICIEYARRNIDTALRPNFTEMEAAIKNTKKG